MTKKNVSRQRSREEGFVLAVIIVFLVVLTLTGFLVASMTRTDVQVVQNIQREKEAFFIAEAGVTEALLRLRRLGDPTRLITVDGLSFNPDIVPGDPASGWTGEITLTRQPPETVGSLFTTTTLQPDNEDRLPYSPVTMEWTGQEARGRSVLAVTSTGSSNRARRTVRIHVIASAGSDAGCLRGGVCAIGSQQCPGILLRGNANVTTEGGVVVNSECEGAISGTGSGSLATTGEEQGIDVVGGTNLGPQGTLSPEPLPIEQGIEDPLGNLPSSPYPVQCSGTHPQGVPIYTTDTPQGPGIYCNGLRFSGTNTFTLEGNYVIAGGTLTISGNPTIGTGPTGVTIHSVRNPDTNQWATIDLGSADRLNLVSPAAKSNPYHGILLNQPLGNTNPITIKATLNTGLDGIIYAPDGHVIFQNQTNPGKDLQIGLVVASAEFVGNNSLTAPTTGRRGGPDRYEPIAWYDQ